MARTITVQLDPYNPDITMTVEAPTAGATVLWVKEELCRQDPTGTAEPRQFRLCSASRPDHVLDDDVAVTQELARLVLASSGDDAAHAGGAGVPAEDASTAEPLVVAIRQGNSQEVALLVVGDTGLESARLQDGRTPLHVALELLGGQAGVSPAKVCEITGILLACDADPNVEVPPLNEPPLQIALRQFVGLKPADAASGLEVLRALLDAKADPNRGDELGETPLFEAACSGSLDACEVLLCYGANPLLKNINGNCAADLATGGEVKQLLEQAAKYQEEEPQVQELEFRQAPDGAYYTKDQFQEFYSGLKEWNEAPRSAAPGGMAPGGLDLDELKEGEEKFSDIRRQVSSSSTAAERRSGHAQGGGPAQRQPMPAATAPSSGASVQKLREQGNEHFKAGRYQEAMQLYSQALGPQPSDAGILCNRAAAALMLKDWDAAFKDALQAVRLDANNVKACERAARSLLLANRLEDGLRFCQQRIKGGPGVAGLTPEQKSGSEWRPFVTVANRLPHHGGLLQQMEQILGDARQAASEGPAGSIVNGVQEMQSLLSETEAVSPFGERLAFTKVRALLFPVPGASGQSEETRRQWTLSALAELDRLIREKYDWPDTHHWRARCLVRLGRRKEAREALKEAMRIAKKVGWVQHLITEQLLDSLEVTETQKEKGNQAFQRQDWGSALQAYNAAVQADQGRWDVEFSAQLHCNRSNARSKLGHVEAALEDANMAVALQPTYTKALFRRGLLHMELNRHVDALKDFEEVQRLAPNFPGLAEWLPRARNWTAAPPKKNFYAVLGVGFDASPAEVKKAYKVAALKWHPDKNRDNAERAEKMFKEILEAFEVLSDPRKRAEYDGLDQQGQTGGFDMAGGFPGFGFGPSSGFWPGGGRDFRGGSRFHAGPGRPFGGGRYQSGRPRAPWESGGAWFPGGRPGQRR